MKRLFESWRKYQTLLTEVTMDQARASLAKQARKWAVRQYVHTIANKMLRDGNPEYSKMTYKERVILAGKNVKNNPQDHEDSIYAIASKAKKNVINALPYDATDNQKALSALWILRVVNTNWTAFSYAHKFNDFGLDAHFDIGDTLEDYFVHHQFMGERDLNRIKDFHELKNIVDAAWDAVSAHQEKQSYADADEGTEIFRDDDEWTIAALHNKGAACSLGKSTSWCTAAPGLDYFKQYYKPNDPLFYFKDKTTGARYQFSYNSRQFMDEDDKDVVHKTLISLTELLLRALGPDKAKEYPWLMKVKTAIDKHGNNWYTASADGEY